MDELHLHEWKESQHRSLLTRHILSATPMLAMRARPRAWENDFVRAKMRWLTDDPHKHYGTHLPMVLR